MDLTKLSPAPWVNLTDAWNAVQEEYYRRTKTHYHGPLRGAKKQSAKKVACLIVVDNYHGKPIDLSNWRGYPDYWDFKKIIALPYDELFRGKTTTRIISHTIEDDGQRSADAEFIAIARNAFDVMMRRGWSPLKSRNGWRVDQDDGTYFAFGKDGVEPAEWADPFTALVAADAWYRENVEE